MKIIRIFCRRTNATPDDEGVRVNVPPGLFDEADEIHISVLFTYDQKTAERLEKEWRHVGRVLIGGPGIGTKGGEFTPGLYVKNGYTITSRGCPNKCWFCKVWRRDGNTRELPIKDGWNILDDNLLACSDGHIRAVFDMLRRQKRRIEFTGGLEAARMKPWIAEELFKLKPAQMFFAYDTPNDLEPLMSAVNLLKEAGFNNKSHAIRCYVLCGYSGDTIEKAESRAWKVKELGVTPMVMHYQDDKGRVERNWKQWARLWSRPAIIWGRQNIIGQDNEQIKFAVTQRRSP